MSYVRDLRDLVGHRPVVFSIFVGATFVAESVEGMPTPDGREATELQFFGLDSLPDDLLTVSRRSLERYHALRRDLRRDAEGDLLG